jgi:hypothetical protein
MNALTGLTAQDIATIAAAGVMGLAAVFIVITLLRPNPPAPMTLWAAVAVILIATIVQIGTKWMDIVLTAHNKISVTLAPDPKDFSRILPDDLGAPLVARPRLWLSTGKAICNPNSGAFDSKASDCLSFTQQFQLHDSQETIYVSVEDAMAELRDRVIKLTAVTRATAIAQLAASNNSPGRSSPIGDNSAAQ